MGKTKEEQQGKEKQEKGEKKEKKDKGEKKDKEGKEKKDKGEKTRNPEKVQTKINSLERKLQALKQQTGETNLSKKYSTNLFGTEIRCDREVRIRVGPVIGKVTSTSAIVLVEVSLTVELTIHLIPRDSKAVAVHKKQLAHKNRPQGFLVEDLVAGTVYDVAIEGVNAKDAHERVGLVRTVPADPASLRIVTLSCDRPERQLDGETNMWVKLAEEVEAGHVDVVLHLGDQVYGQKEFQDAQAVLRYSGIPRTTDGVESTKPEVKRIYKVIKDRMRDIYRFTWNLPGTRKVLSHASNLMIWSDNDIYNDFTIAKEEGQAGLEPVMLYLAHQVYREYQRQLWDVDFENDRTTDEFHFHRWGHTGVFIHDMRGNRITTKGEQRPENPILNDKQWDAFNKFLADPELRNLIICSEIPYVGDSPSGAKENSKKAGLEFIVDHWPYNDTELLRLFDLVFDWKAENKDGRDVVFVGGDIHVGVTSTIKDNKNDVEVTHLTATPISNHVCKFFPKLTGAVNDRYSYTHVPLINCRNYGLLISKNEGGHAHIDAKLVAGAPIGHH